jgi:LDH2 family malate/lactate/ureidoglycolate dehydrogenase
MFIAGMEHYLTKLRTSTPRTGARVMAPGDREWDVAALRAQKGIPLDPVTQASFAELTKTTGLSL